MLDGRMYLADLLLPAVLDSLIAARRIAPTVAVCVDNATSAARLADLGNHERFVRFVADDLVPWTRAHYKVSHDPHHAIIAGASAGGVAAAFIAMHRPDLFGNVVSQSGAFWFGAEGAHPPFEWVTAQLASRPRADLRFVLDVGSSEDESALGGSAPSILKSSRRLRDVLRAKGYDVRYTEVPGGRHTTESWAARLPGHLAALAKPR